MSLQYMDAGAVLSDCGLYRYVLSRRWELPRFRPLLWIMLNPSTADGSTDDPTIRKCVGYARRWGYGAIDVVNLYALRATDPKELICPPVDPVGPENDGVLQSFTDKADKIICAWGANAAKIGRRRGDDRAAKVLAQIGSGGACALKLTKGGDPYHPLYVRNDVEPVVLEVAR